MRAIQRKTTPGVVQGKVQRKHHLALNASDYYEVAQRMPVIHRRRPGEGYRHLIKQKDLYQFLEILPDWSELSHGLNAIVLAPGEWETLGYHVPGVVHLCAWERKLWTEQHGDFYSAHEDILERLGVPCQPTTRGFWLCKFTGGTARAFQLLHILLHELGHHHDRITTRSKVDASRGEPYAEAYARQYADRIWDQYLRRFGLD